MDFDRRRFLTGAAASAAIPCLPGTGFGKRPVAIKTSAEHRLVIEPMKLEIAPGVQVSTVAYNGQVPGPVLRVREDAPVAIDVVNRCGHAEIVHWHGLRTGVHDDGAMEEGSPMITNGAALRYNLKPTPSGTRWYHTHSMAGEDLTRGQYSGQFGFLIVEPKQDPARYDREFLLAVHHFEPYFAPMSAMMSGAGASASAEPMQSEQHASSSGADVAYRHATINGKCLFAGEPLRVRRGERVLLRVLNASATDACTLALPGHSFHVIAMDGNPVPRPHAVDVLYLAAAERIDAVLEMNTPGVWVLGSTLDAERAMGLGIVVEYEHATGPPVWQNAKAFAWDYGAFSSPTRAATPDEAILLTFKDVGMRNGSKFDTWTINDQSWPDVDAIEFLRGRRYRLFFQNGSADPHPMHLHRHSFELVQLGTRDVSGLMKDVVNVPPLSTVAVDVIADNPGDSLLHCHMQLHMDFGFMTIVKYTG